MFDWKKPTVEMLGRWQPWHDGHTELFRRALQKTGQVCIMYRDVAGVDAGVDGQADNPFHFEEVKKNIIKSLSKHGYEEGKEYPKKMSVGLHCRIIGRPGRVQSLKKFLDYVAKHKDVWICRRIDIAKNWIENHSSK